MGFYQFFLECSLNEVDTIRKHIFIKLALCNGGGHIVNRGNSSYLCIGNAREFKIPSGYDRRDHLKLVDDMKHIGPQSGTRVQKPNNRKNSGQVK